MKRRPVAALTVVGSGVLFAAVLLVGPRLSDSGAPPPGGSLPATTASATAETLPGASPASTSDPKWTDYGTFWIGAIGLLFVVAGLAYAGLQLGQVQAATAVNTMSSIAGRWDSELLIRARMYVNRTEASGKDLCIVLEEESRNDTENHYAVAALIGFFEELGYLCRLSDGPSREPRHPAIAEYVIAVFQGPTIWYYELLEKFIEAGRAQQKPLASQFTRLYGLMKTRT